MQTKTAAKVLLGIGVLIVLSYGLVYWQSRPAPRPTPPDVPPAATTVAFLNQRLQARPSALEYALLGQAYARQARESGNYGDYARAEEALRRSLQLVPGNADATLALAGTLVATHDFEGALALSQPLADQPRTAPQALAIVGDAHLSLGNYAEAEAAYAALADETPPNLSRRALWADLQGDRGEALTLMQQAAELAWQNGDDRVNLAWYDYQVGELYFKSGRLDEARARYQSAVEVFDRYALGYAGLGKVWAAQGRFDEARAQYEKAIAIIPQPEYLAALGDVYTRLGDVKAAQAQYDIVSTIARLDEANAVLYNRQLALFYANHDRDVDKALQLAQAEIEARQDVFGYDTLAWALYKNERFEEAASAMEQAMQLGTRDALLFYHAGLIQYALGNTGRAHALLTEALTINPYFDLLHAALAQATLDQLGAR